MECQFRQLFNFLIFDNEACFDRGTRGGRGGRDTGRESRTNVERYLCFGNYQIVSQFLIKK